MTKVIRLERDCISFDNEFGGTGQLYFKEWKVIEVKQLSTPLRNGNFKGSLLQAVEAFDSDDNSVILEYGFIGYFNVCWKTKKELTN
jgi:hypothetical protein